MKRKRNKKIDLDDLYKRLKCCDKYVLEHFNDENLSDRDYLYYALNSDIFSNALSMVMNLLIKNLFSVGIDQNCRTIIESFTILKMLDLGEITPLQCKIFRYQYALVDLDNFGETVREEDKERPAYKTLISDGEKALDALSEHFGKPKEELRKKTNLLREPRLYLKKKPNDDIRFSTLIGKYQVFGDSTSDMYSLFSIYTHARFDDDAWEQSTKIVKTRLDSGFRVLKHVSNYLCASNFPTESDGVLGFAATISANPALCDQSKNASRVRMAMNKLREETCYFPIGYDSFSYSFFVCIENLVVDMLLCESLGYCEQVVAKFKPFIEYASFYSKIQSTSDLEEFKARKLAFKAGSKLQLTEQLAKFGFAADGSIEDDLKEAYDGFYAKGYGVDFETFVAEIKKDVRYCLSPNKEERKYNQIIKSAIDSVIEPGHPELVKLVNNLSQDMSHASGYNFNSTPGMSEIHCHESLFFVWRFLIMTIFNIELTIPKKVDLSYPIALFQSLMQSEDRAVRDSYASFATMSEESNPNQ